MAADPCKDCCQHCTELRYPKHLQQCGQCGEQICDQHLRSFGGMDLENHPILEFPLIKGHPVFPTCDKKECLRCRIWIDYGGRCNLCKAPYPQSSEGRYRVQCPGDFCEEYGTVASPLCDYCDTHMSHLPGFEIPKCHKCGAWYCEGCTGSKYSDQCLRCEKEAEGDLKYANIYEQNQNHRWYCLWCAMEYPDHEKCLCVINT